MNFSMKWTGGGLEKFEKAVKVLGNKDTRKVYRAAINREGAQLRKDALKILPEQSGLGKKTISRALGKPVRAAANRLTYKLTTRGGFVRMHHFKPVESDGGVTAFPRNKPVFQEGHFITGGLFPNRQALPFKGLIFRPQSWGRTGKTTWGRPFDVGERSDVRIPDELTSAAMESAADKHRDQMEREILATLKRMSGGVIG